MCGRIYVLQNHMQIQRIACAGRITNQQNVKDQQKYNIGPNNYIPAIRTNSQQVFVNNQNIEEKLENNKELIYLKWGMHSPYQIVINARIEELEQKYMFKRLINSNRCVIIISGFYEWDKNKNPFNFKSKKQNHLFIAGLFDKNDDLVILTRSSLNSAAFIHDRMPVILDETEVDIWLNCKDFLFRNIFKSIMQNDNPKWADIISQKLSPYVNSISHQGPQCLMTYEQYLEKLDSQGIKKYFKPIEKNEKTQSNNIHNETLSIGPNMSQNTINQQNQEKQQQIKINQHHKLFKVDEQSIEISSTKKLNINNKFNQIESVVVYTDGSSDKSKKGRGGWAFIILLPEQSKIIQGYGSIQNGTNNQMEFLAPIKALHYIKQNFPNYSELLIKSLTQWIKGWKLNGWLNANKQPIQNKELLEELDKLQQQFNVKWEKVKGHNGDVYNEMVDKLANKARLNLKEEISKSCTKQQIQEQEFQFNNTQDFQEQIEKQF